MTMNVPEATASEQDLRPNLAVLFGVGSAVALISAMSAPTLKALSPAPVRMTTRT